LRDLVRAKMLLDNGGLSPSPASLSGSVSDILAFLSDNPESAAWLAGLLPSESAAVVKASAWYKNAAAPGTADSRQTTPPSTRRIEFSGLSFIGGSTLISVTAVPRSLYESFLRENPQWKDEQGDIFSQNTNTAEITGVSWYAAQAFCQWLTRRLPSSMAGMEVRLPTETELESAALDAVLRYGQGSWEWCADPFAPLKFIKAPKDAVIAAGSPERTLYNLGAAGAQESRASLPPELSSPLVTFRPAIAEKDSGF